MIQADLLAKTHIGTAILVVSGVQVRSSPMEVSPALFAGVGQTGRNTNLDARLRHLVQQTMEKLQLPLTEEEFRENWENLSEEKKMELVDSTISLLKGMKKEG